MRNRHFGLLFISSLLFFCFSITTKTEGNPFISGVKEDAKKSVHEPVRVIGQVLVAGEQYAVIEYKEKQLLLRAGEASENLKVLKLKNNKLTYKIADTVYHVSIGKKNNQK